MTEQGGRFARIERRTAETEIAIELGLDGSGSADVSTGVGFFDHMLTAFARHGLFDLSVSCKGDLEVDAHHTVEDVGICLGQALDGLDLVDHSAGIGGTSLAPPGSPPPPRTQTRSTSSRRCWADLSSARPATGEST